MISLELSEAEKKDLTEDEIELAMARKLEILTLPHLRRKMQFFYAGWNLEGKKEAYHEPIDKDELEKRLNESSPISIPTVCKPICTLVAEILNENGIKAETISCDTDIFGHTDVVITTKSNKRYIINYLEDMENIQTGMITPDFMSEKYFKRRYEKFKEGKTPDGKILGKISFLSQEELGKIDDSLGYKEYNMYMDEVMTQIAKEFLEFKKIMSENEWLTKQKQLEKENASLEKMEKAKKEIYSKYENMTKEEELEAKLDWIFEFFNKRGNITGHTDFVMYYSRLLLKKVLTEEEYNLITRYEGTIDRNKVKENAKINEALDFKNEESSKKLNFVVIKTNKKAYAFSTKPCAYVTLDDEEFEELSEYANLSGVSRPSDLLGKMWDNGRGTPVLFHPLGISIINERAEMIDKNLSTEEREKEVERLVAEIKAVDDPMPSVTIPYPNGETKKVYIDDNYEIIVEDKDKKTIYHFNAGTEEVEEETILIGDGDEIEK